MPSRPGRASVDRTATRPPTVRAARCRAASRRTTVHGPRRATSARAACPSALLRDKSRCRVRPSPSQSLPPNPPSREPRRPRRTQILPSNCCMFARKCPSRDLGGKFVGGGLRVSANVGAPAESSASPERAFDETEGSLKRRAKLPGPPCASLPSWKHWRSSPRWRAAAPALREGRAAGASKRGQFGSPAT